MADPKLSISARFRRLVLCGLALFLLAAPNLSHAGPQAPDDGCLTDQGCRENYDQAVVLFEGGRFEAALPKFQAAYARRQMPWLLINIGRTLHRLGRPKEALEYYERYKLAESRPDAETQDRLDKYVTQAKALAEAGPAAQTPPPSDNTVQTPPPPPPKTGEPVKEEKPIYKKWWFWTAIGGGALAIIIIGAAAGAAAHNSSSSPTAMMLPDGVQKVMFNF